MIIAATIYLLRSFCVMSTAIPMPQKEYNCNRIVSIVWIYTQSTILGESECMESAELWRMNLYSVGNPRITPITLLRVRNRPSCDEWIFTQSAILGLIRYSPSEGKESAELWRMNLYYVLVKKGVFVINVARYWLSFCYFVMQCEIFDVDGRTR